MLLSRVRNVAREPLRSLRLEIFYFCHTSIFYSTGITMFPSSSHLDASQRFLHYSKARNSQASPKVTKVSFPSRTIRRFGVICGFGCWIRRARPSYLSPRRKTREIRWSYCVRMRAQMSFPLAGGMFHRQWMLTARLRSNFEILAWDTTVILQIPESDWRALIGCNARCNPRAHRDIPNVTCNLHS